jgi:hypothetical protein
MSPFYLSATLRREYKSCLEKGPRVMFPSVVLANAIVFALVTSDFERIESWRPESTQQEEHDQQKPSKHQGNSNPEATASDGDQQTQSGPSVQKEQNRWWEKCVQWIDRRGNFVVASSTIVIAAFTAFLFLATVLLWRSGEKHSGRELRAYLSVTPKFILNFGTERFTGVDCIVKNHGQTPAFEINHVFEIGVFDPGFQFPSPTKQMGGNAAIFPGSEISTRFFNDRAFTTVEVADIETGTRRIFFWGRTTYRDAFKKRRCTSFSASVGGQDFAENVRALSEGRTAPEFRWVYEERHNDAT